MLVSEGKSRTLDIDIRLAATFAAIAGALNSAGFQAAGLFSANMTGNASALSDHLALGELNLAAKFFLLVALFISGSFVSGLLIETGRRIGVRAVYALSILFEAALLLALGVGSMILPNASGGWLLISGLSFVMGVQNAATTRISNWRVRTTHVSGMATDIGIGLAALATGTDNPVSIQRLRLHLSTIAAFVIGGLAGAALYLEIGETLLVLCALVLMTIALPAIRRSTS
jgi:uncharacterized membrane protein YoaK (UPF0700 family)